jgi:hypothetical protein
MLVDLTVIWLILLPFNVLYATYLAYFVVVLYISPFLVRNTKKNLETPIAL